MNNSGIWPWLKDLFISADFFAGLVAGIVSIATIVLSDELEKAAIEALLIEAGLGVAILAVALTALAILVSFLGDEYLVVLERGDRGVSGAFFPYKAVAVISGIASLAAFASAFLWALSPLPIKAGLFATATLMTVWALVGTVQLVFITSNHGTDRAELMREMRDAEQKIRRHRGVG